MALSTIETRAPLDKSGFAEQARRACHLLKALSHERRLLILCFLEEGEKSVSEIEEALDMAQAAVSQQLARLRSDGLVKARRDGRSIYYDIASAEARQVIGTLYALYCTPEFPTC